MRRSGATPGRLRHAVGCAATAGCLLAAVACGGSHAGDDPGSGSASPTIPAAAIAMSPGNGSTHARPEHGVRVTVSGGKLAAVTMRSGSHSISGKANQAKTAWRSRRLLPARHYAVTAVAVNSAGHKTVRRYAFRTLTPSISNHVRINTADGGTYGVGIPLIMSFSAPVIRKAAVERRMTVTSTGDQTGAWHWISPQQAVYRSKHYWHPGTTVHLVAKIAGTRSGQKGYINNSLTETLHVGARHVSVVDAEKHHMVVTSGGKTVRTIPVSVGKGTKAKYTTTSGVHVVFQQQKKVLMDSSTVPGQPKKGQPGYYHEWEYWAEKITFGGEYVHENPDTVGVQGSTNVSHGCVNLNKANAKWFFNFSRIGDIVDVVGTNRPMKVTDGWGYYQMSWHDWLAGSALHH